MLRGLQVSSAARRDVAVPEPPGRHGGARGRRRRIAHASPARDGPFRGADPRWLRRRARRRRDRAGGRRGRRDARVRDRRAAGRPLRRSRGSARGDPVCLVCDRDPGIPRARSRQLARRLRLRRPSLLGLGRARGDLELEQVGEPRSVGPRARPRLPRPLRRSRRHRAPGRRAPEARARRARDGRDRRRARANVDSPLAAGDAAVRPRPSRADRQGRRCARVTAGPRARRRGLRRGRHPRLHRVGRGAAAESIARSFAGVA